MHGPRLLNLAGAVVLALLTEEHGLTAPDLAQRIGLAANGRLGLVPSLNQVHVTLGGLEKAKRITRRRTSQKTRSRHNPPTLVTLTQLGRTDARRLADFVQSVQVAPPMATSRESAMRMATK